MLISTFFSLVLHGLVVTIFVVGIPFLERDLKDAEPLVFVSVVDKVPETNQPKPSAKAKTESDEIHVASKTPPSPSQASSAILPSPTKKLNQETNETVEKQPSDDQSERLSLQETQKNVGVVLPETSRQADAQELPIAKPRSVPEKLVIASPIKRPKVPIPQKKPISRPEVKPSKKEQDKPVIPKAEAPEVAQTSKLTTRNLLKPLIDNKITPKPKSQNSKDKLQTTQMSNAKPDNTMSGVLQNLAKATASTGEKSRSKAPEKAKNTLDAEEINSNLQSSMQLKPNRSIRLGASEIDRLRAHISRCWSPPAAAPDAEKLIVDVRVRADRDGTVTSVESLDPGRFQIDGFYRTAARAAVRAVQECSPLPLPSEKHEVWKDFKFRFDPKFING